MSKKQPQRKTTRPAVKPASAPKNPKKQAKKEENKPAEMNQILKSLREPWLQKRSAMIALTGVSLVLMVLVAWNIIKGSGDWGQGLLWGFVFGASVWLVYFGMTWFHSLFNSKNK
ncbi:MAG: hypothetical protein AAGU04_07740 [Anaerolineaceae bacterium]|jgi:hypothetical protein